MASDQEKYTNRDFIMACSFMLIFSISIGVAIANERIKDLQDSVNQLIEMNGGDANE